MEKYWVRIPNNLDISHAIQKEIFQKGYPWICSGYEIQNKVNTYFKINNIRDGVLSNNTDKPDTGIELSIYDIFTDRLPEFKKPEPPEKMHNITGFGPTSETTIIKALRTEFS